MNKQQKSIYKKVSICFILLSLGLLSAQVACAETVSPVEWELSGDNYEIHSLIEFMIDSSDNIYILARLQPDLEYNVLKYDINGNYITSWGSFEKGDNPHKITFDKEGNVYVLSSGNHVYKYDGEGSLITKLDIESEDYLYDFDVDSLGYIYALEAENSHIIKYDCDGNIITKWGSKGMDDGEFVCNSDPSNPLLIGPSDDIYIYGWFGCTKFDSDGNFICQMSEKPVNGVFDTFGNYYLLQPDSIMMYDSNDNLITTYSLLTEESLTSNPDRVIAVDSSGNFYIYRVDIRKIEKYVVDGQDDENTAEQSQDSSSVSEVTSDSTIEQTQMSIVETDDSIAEAETASTENTDDKESPGFGIVCGIVCLFAAVLYNKR